jgi:hypothetical protein
LDSDLSDKELTFWTTPPHFMLVATYNNSNNVDGSNKDIVVGMVAIQKREESGCWPYRGNFALPVMHLNTALSIVLPVLLWP